MVRTARGSTRNGGSVQDGRKAVMAAAERCIDRFGIRKTTMDDVAREAGISRPSIYRFFADREALLVALTTERSRALVEKTHDFISRQTTFSAAIVGGLLYLADHGRRDPFTRLLVAPEGWGFGHSFGATSTAVELTAEFWDPLLDAAEQDGRMRSGLDREQVRLWLANIGLMLMHLLENGTSLETCRSMISDFVVPAFVVEAGAGAELVLDYDSELFPA